MYLKTFSLMNAIGIVYDKPTALDFKYRMKRYILGKYSTNVLCNERVWNVSAESDLSCLASLLATGEASDNSSLTNPAKY